jgi:hypothetical protein
MHITWLDRSNFFRGLLILIRRDGKVTDAEMELMLRIGAALDFDPKFCAGAIGTILVNKHIGEEPPVFSSVGLAKKFLRDAVTLAFSNGNVHPREEEWLGCAARKNGVGPSWLVRQMRDFPRRRVPFSLEADGLLAE